MYHKPEFLDLNTNFVNYGTPACIVMKPKKNWFVGIAEISTRSNFCAACMLLDQFNPLGAWSQSCFCIFQQDWLQGGWKWGGFNGIHHKKLRPPLKKKPVPKIPLYSYDFRTPFFWSLANFSCYSLYNMHNIKPIIFPKRLRHTLTSNFMIDSLSSNF